MKINLDLMNCPSCKKWQHYYKPADKTEPNGPDVLRCLGCGAFATTSDYIRFDAYYPVTKVNPKPVKVNTPHRTRMKTKCREKPTWGGKTVQTYIDDKGVVRYRVILTKSERETAYALIYKQGYVTAHDLAEHTDLTEIKAKKRLVNETCFGRLVAIKNTADRHAIVKGLSPDITLYTISREHLLAALNPRIVTITDYVPPYGIMVFPKE